MGLGPFRPLLPAMWPIGARPLSATFVRQLANRDQALIGQFSAVSARSETSACPPPRPGRSSAPTIPKLRTFGRAVRKTGTILVRSGSNAPLLRTLDCAVRNYGTMASFFANRVPYLRTVGQTVRNLGTVGCPRRRPDEAGEPCLAPPRAGAWPKPAFVHLAPRTQNGRFLAAGRRQTSETACMELASTHIRRFPVAGRPETS